MAEAAAATPQSGLTGGTEIAVFNTETRSARGRTEAVELETARTPAVGRRRGDARVHTQYPCRPLGLAILGPPHHPTALRAVQVVSASASQRSDFEGDFRHLCPLPPSPPTITHQSAPHQQTVDIVCRRLELRCAPDEIFGQDRIPVTPRAIEEASGVERLDRAIDSFDKRRSVMATGCQCCRRRTLPELDAESGCALSRNPGAS